LGNTWWLSAYGGDLQVVEAKDRGLTGAANTNYRH
jgi:hypothetical protein